MGGGVSMAIKEVKDSAGADDGIRLKAHRLQRLRKRAASLKVWLVLLIIVAVALPIGIFSLGTHLGDQYRSSLPVVNYQEGDPIAAGDAIWLTLEGDAKTGFFTVQKKYVGVNTWQYRFFNDGYIVIPLFLLSLLSVIGVVWLFYRFKLQKPFRLLTEGMAHIRRQDLNFSVSYRSQDELGELCASFETMRLRLDEAFRELWDAEAAERQLTQAFAHDLRTPLTVLKGYTGMLEQEAGRDALRPEQVQARSRLMLDNISRMERYLDAMREMRRLEEWALRPEPVELGAYAERLRCHYGRLAAAAGKQVEVTLAAEGVVHWDTALVSRVVDNLAANALAHAAAKVRLAISGEADTVVIRVMDDGKGFSAEAHKRAFEAFYRGDAARSGPGLGLGLGIARSLAVRHGGTLAVGNRAASAGEHASAGDGAVSGAGGCASADSSASEYMDAGSCVRGREQADTGVADRDERTDSHPAPIANGAEAVLRLPRAVALPGESSGAIAQAAEQDAATMREA